MQTDSIWVKRFPYSVSHPSLPDTDSLPWLPIVLEYQNRHIEVTGLVDSGATVNVLPYSIGIALGARWQPSKATLRLAGNLANAVAQPLLMMANIADFSPTQLVFAWTNSENVPLILGQVNFFMAFEVCFYRSQLFFEIQPKFR